MKAETAKGATKNKPVYAEPMEFFNHDKKISLAYTILAITGLSVCIAVLYITMRYYPKFFDSWAFLIIVAALFCIWEIYINFTQYLSRVRFRVFENALIPSYIPFMHAVHGKDYLVPFSRMRGMTFRTIQVRKKTGWQCDIVLNDGRVIEFYGGQRDNEFYKFLQKKKEECLLPDGGSLNDEGDLKQTVKKGYQEQLARWGIKPKKRKNSGR